MTLQKYVELITRPLNLLAMRSQSHRYDLCNDIFFRENGVGRGYLDWQVPDLRGNYGVYVDVTGSYVVLDGGLPRCLVTAT